MRQIREREARRDPHLSTPEKPGQDLDPGTSVRFLVAALPHGPEVAAIVFIAWQYTAFAIRCENRRLSVAESLEPFSNRLLVGQTGSAHSEQRTPQPVEIVHVAPPS